MFGFNGVVEVVSDGRILLRKAYGRVEPFGGDLTPETRFFAGSVTKQFTAAAVMRLVDEGKVDPGRSIGTYLPWLKAPVADLTVHQLLSHTSGIAVLPNFEGSDEEIPGPVDKRAYAEAFARKPLRFNPGSRFEYSNSGPYLLGLLIEVVSGMSASSFFEKEIFGKAGMEASYLPESDTAEFLRRSMKEGPFAVGMKRLRSGELVPDLDHLDMSVIFTTGSMVSTADDLVRWSRWFFDDRFLTPGTRARMLRENLGQYGYDLFHVSLPNGMNLYLHEGGMEGYHALLGHVPEAKMTIVFLSNVVNQYYGTIARDLARIALGEKIEAPRIVSVRNPVEYAGIFRGRFYDDSLEWQTGVKDSKLILKRKSGEFELIPIGDDTFFSRMMRGPVRFERDGEGRVVRLTVPDDGLPPSIILSKVNR